MPLTPKGEKIMSGMKEQYGPDKAKEVFYASKNKGTITGVDSRSRDAGQYPSETDITPERQKDLLGEPSNPEETPRGPLKEAKAPGTGDKKSGDQSSTFVPGANTGAPMNNLGMGIPAPNPPPNISSQPSSTSSTTTTGDALRSMNNANRAFWAGRRR